MSEYPSETASNEPSVTVSAPPSSPPSLTLSNSPSIIASAPPSVEESDLPTFVASEVPSSHPSERASSSPSLATTERPSIGFSETPSAKSEVYPTPSPVTVVPSPSPTFLEEDGNKSFIGTVRSGENNGGPVISSIENGINNSGKGSVPSESSNATFILASLFALTVLGGMVYLLSKKYPEKFKTRGGFDRLGTILRIVRGDNLVDIVSEASTSTNSRKSDRAPARHEDEANGQKSRPNNDSSAKSAVTFAEDLVTVIPIPSPAPMKRNVNFADSMGEELTTELGPSARYQSNSLDEVDDVLGSSSRSTYSGGEFAESSGTFDSTENYDSSGIEVPFRGFGISSPTS